MECPGGIRLYCEPIYAGREVVGAINIGYGDPPLEPERQRELAGDLGFALHRLKMEEVHREALRRSEEEKRLLEQRYQHFQRMESIGRLAGGVAHDFNNLLSPILAYSEMLRGELAREDSRREMVEEIHAAALRAKELTRQLLALGRRQTLETKLLDLNQVLYGLKKLLRRTIREDVHIEIRTEHGLGAVTADVGQIEQVIMNLAVNAQDAMPDGGTMTIETGEALVEEEAYAGGVQDEEPAPGRYVTLSLSDTGVGMDEETMEHIFEPFFTTKAKGEGTGLGLATVHGIVKQHGGGIRVESEPGRGTTFKIYLPRSEEALGESETEAAYKASAGGEETILVVEDDDKVRKLTRKILQSQGYNVIEAGGGREALETAASHHGPIDLLLADVVMPGMNGKEVYETLAEDRPGLRVLYMSGYTDDVIPHRQVLEKGVSFIHKPFGVEQLASKVRQVLDRPESGSGSSG